MERCHDPGRIDLENRAHPDAAACLCRAVEAGVACLDQCADGIRALTPVEAMKRRQRPRRIDLENRAAVLHTAVLRRTVEAAVASLDHPAGRIRAAVAAVEAMERCQRSRR